jgi:hypothetical protein
MTVSKQTAKLWQDLDITDTTIWVDVGLQYTFVLFAMASTKMHCGPGTNQSFYNFTTYPWLKSLFKNHFFSPHSEYLRYIEKQAEKSHKKSHDLRRMPEPMTTTMSLATIIEDKPCKSKIIEYLTQKRDICMDADDSD